MQILEEAQSSTLLHPLSLFEACIQVCYSATCAPPTASSSDAAVALVSAAVVAFDEKVVQLSFPIS
jgi:hypothetical protein